jgi:hypothetical protein
VEVKNDPEQLTSNKIRLFFSLGGTNTVVAFSIELLYYTLLLEHCQRL